MNFSSDLRRALDAARHNTESLPDVVGDFAQWNSEQSVQQFVERLADGPDLTSGADAAFEKYLSHGAGLMSAKAGLASLLGVAVLVVIGVTGIHESKPSLQGRPAELQQAAVSVPERLDDTEAHYVDDSMRDSNARVAASFEGENGPRNPHPALQQKPIENDADSHSLTEPGGNPKEDTTDNQKDIVLKAAAIPSGHLQENGPKKDLGIEDLILSPEEAESLRDGLEYRDIEQLHVQSGKKQSASGLVNRLSDELEVYQHAVALERQEKFEGATEAYLTYISLYPTGRLAESAHFGLVRIACRTKDDGCVRVGRRYLKRFSTHASEVQAFIR